MAQFRDDSLEQWFSDLTWAWDESKSRSLIVHIFSRRKRVSQVEGRLWRRVIALYWKSGWTLRQIGEHFGVGRENVRRIVKALRREAAIFFGQSAQPAPGQVVQSKTKRPMAAPIEADPANESQEHWNAVLASHGLPDPDRRARGWSWRNPVYKFDWQGKTSVHAEAWAEFYETQAKPKPTLHAQQKTGGTGSWGKANQVGTKTVEIDGKSYDVRVFEAGRACTFGWAADPRRNAGSPADKGYLAHTLIDRAIDGDREAREYLREYERLEAEKYTDEKLFKIVPAIADPCEGRPFIQDFAVAPTSRGIDVRIDRNGTVHKKGSNQICGKIERADSYFLDERNPQQLEEPMQFQQAAEIIKRHDIPRSTVARLSGVVT